MIQLEELIIILNDFASVWPKIFVREDRTMNVMKNSEEFRVQVTYYIFIGLW